MRKFYIVQVSQLRTSVALPGAVTDRPPHTGERFEPMTFDDHSPPSTYSRRRALLATGGSLTAAGLAGCSVLLGGSSDGSGYDLRAENHTDETFDVRLSAERRVGDSVTETETVFDETVTLEAEATREWDSALTKEGETKVLARVPDATYRSMRSSLSVNVGGGESLDASALTAFLMPPGILAAPAEVTLVPGTEPPEDSGP